jgi:nucleoside-diphosphate-sugar epimerase
MHAMSELHVVLGATGALGSAIVNQLCADELPVRTLVRNPALAASMLPDNVEIVQFDAHDAAQMRAGCAGATHLYHCVYSPDKLGVIAETLAAIAREQRARLVFPSNADVYGPALSNPINETHPHAATTERGKWRMAIERALLDAPDIELVILRLGAMYGAHIRGSYMSVVFESAHKNQKTFWLGALDAPSSLIYAPDAAAAAVLLARAPDTAGQSWHVVNPEALTGAQFMTKVWDANGSTPNFGVRSATLFKLVGSLVPDAKRLAQVLYQFEKPFVLDSAKLCTRFPSFAFTPHDLGIQDTVDWFRAEFDV